MSKELSIYEQVIAIYPELTDSDLFVRGVIHIQDDLDGTGTSIRRWEYEKPLPESLVKYFR
jgi:hypothetical protein